MQATNDRRRTITLGHADVVRRQRAADPNLLNAKCRRPGRTPRMKPKVAARRVRDGLAIVRLTARTAREATKPP
jgi:hypothetical protein